MTELTGNRSVRGLGIKDHFREVEPLRRWAKVHQSGEKKLSEYSETFLEYCSLMEDLDNLYYHR